MSATATAFEEQTVYWVVSARLKDRHQRHAIADRPGRYPAGDEVESLCDSVIVIPTTTPYGLVPVSQRVTDRCRDCTYKIKPGYQQVNWDF